MGAYDITTFGAVGDGRTNDAAAIQRAVDACHQAGGGTVLVPAGRTYLCGSFELRSHVELHVERGAVLLGATREEDYPLFAFTTGSEAGKRLWIGGRGADHIAISGGGVIDGNSSAFITGRTDWGYQTLRWRPAMTCFENCRNIRVRDITLRHSANWALHFSGCEDIVVHGVSILNDLRFPNCDGIDPDHCRNVRISDCHIEAGDDCIVLKNTRPFDQYGPCENITVTGCTLVSTSSAIKIGTESVDDFRDIVFANCVVRGSNRALSVQLRDEGNVENVLFENIVVETKLAGGGWWGAGEPIYVTAVPRTHQTPVGRIRNVRFRNILARSENGVFVMGSRPDRIENVVLDDVRLEIAKVTEHEGGAYDIRPCPPDILPAGSTPVGELTDWGTRVARPNVGVFIQNATNVRLRRFEMAWGEGLPEYYTHALEVHDAPGLRVEDFEGDSARPGQIPARAGD